MFPTLPYIKYRGMVYRPADNYAPAADSIKHLMESAVAALGGHETGQQLGGYTKLRDGGEPWSVEVVAPVAKLQPSSKISDVLPYSTVNWCGRIEAALENGSVVISAEGSLFLDGLCHDDAARLLTDQDLVTGTWDGSVWSWKRDLRG